MKRVDLRLREMDPALMWALKQIAASRHQTLRAFLLAVLEDTVKKNAPKK
jgi:hypothetical protein